MICRSMRPVSVTMVVGFFGRPPFPEDETGVQIVEVERAKLLDGDRLVIELAFFGGIVALRDTAQLDLRLLPRAFGGPDPMQADGVAARAAAVIDIG